MTAAELSAARETIGFTPEQLAAELGVAPPTYAEWESGTAQIPARHARDVAYRAALAEREDALSASGLPECEWVTAWHDAPQPPKAEEQLARLESLSAHGKSCPQCVARERFVTERFGPLPEPPLPAWMRVIGRLGDAVDRLPPWARPAIWGALVVGGMTALRMLAAVRSLVQDPSRGLLMLGILAAAMAAGALGGLVYSFAGRPLRRVPRVGRYLAGIVTVAGYMGAIVLGAALAGQPIMNDGAGFTAFVVVTTLFGIAVGHFFFRTDPPDT